MPIAKAFGVPLARAGRLEVDATLRDEPFGEAGPIVPQRHLGGFPIPNRGLFAVGRAVFETYDADRHVQSMLACV